MQKNSLKNAHRIIAGIMGMMMLVMMLFSFFYIAAESRHNCCGDDCPVCACIDHCMRTIRQVNTAAKVSVAVIIPFLLVLVSTLTAVYVVSGETLVSRKVRMDN